MKADEKIKSLLLDALRLTEENGVELDALRGRARMIISKIFSDNSPYLTDLGNIRFHGSPYDVAAGRDTGAFWEAGKERFVNLCHLMLEDIKESHEQNKDSMEPKQLIESLLHDLSKLPQQNEAELDALKRNAEMIILKVFPPSSLYLKHLEEIAFHVESEYPGMDMEEYALAWKSGCAKFKNLCLTMLEDIRLSQSAFVKQSKEKSDKIFIVHGHDEEMKQAAARTVEKLRLKPIILHEQVNKGAPTVIEKLLRNSDVGFAIILLSPDDVGHPKKSPEKAQPRPRQNVIFEFGLFVGKLGRENVFVLHRKVPDFEMLSDFAGGIYQEFDAAGAWRYELGRELKAAQYDIDLNKLHS